MSADTKKQIPLRITQATSDGLDKLRDGKGVSRNAIIEEVLDAFVEGRLVIPEVPAEIIAPPSAAGEIGPKGTRTFSCPSGVDPAVYEKRVHELSAEVPYYTASRLARLELLAPQRKPGPLRRAGTQIGVFAGSGHAELINERADRLMAEEDLAPVAARAIAIRMLADEGALPKAA